MENLTYGVYIMVAVTIAYAGVATDLLGRGNQPLALVFAAYSLANIGFIWSMLRG